MSKDTPRSQAAPGSGEGELRELANLLGFESVDFLADLIGYGGDRADGIKKLQRLISWRDRNQAQGTDAHREIFTGNLERIQSNDINTEI